jgi:hypothetical protein
MLSEQQWSWLEEQLQQPADLRLIVSSAQVLNDGTGFKCWSHLSRERQRLYDLLEQHSPSSIVSLCGYRHMGGFYQLQEGWIREVTASSFTHSFPLAAEHKDCKIRRKNAMKQILDASDHLFVRIIVERLKSIGNKKTLLYQDQHLHKSSDAGNVLQSRSYNFT